MPLTVISVAYPFAPVDADPVGGAEQILAACDRALVAAGHRSIVIAMAGSEVAGELVPIPPVAHPDEPGETQRAERRLREQLSALIHRSGADVVHLHSLSFADHLPPPGLPVLVTLHLPLAWYPGGALSPARPRTWLHPVSPSQAALAPPGARLSEPIENGVALTRADAAPQGYAVILGRMCPEKGFVDAIEAARLAGCPLTMAGMIFPYAEHRRYFEEEVRPRLTSDIRWLGPVHGADKRRLLAGARAVLIPSHAAETSSLVAMEALAQGTPVIAYARGALPDIVEHGRTGLLVETPAEMAAALRAVGTIDRALCRAEAERRFDVRRMTDRYLARYHEVAA